MVRYNRVIQAHHFIAFFIEDENDPRLLPSSGTLSYIFNRVHLTVSTGYFGRSSSSPGTLRYFRRTVLTSTIVDDGNRTNVQRQQSGSTVDQPDDPAPSQMNSQSRDDTATSQRRHSRALGTLRRI